LRLLHPCTEQKSSYGLAAAIVHLQSSGVGASKAIAQVGDVYNSHEQNCQAYPKNDLPSAVNLPVLMCNVPDYLMTAQNTHHIGSSYGSSLCGASVECNRICLLR